MKKHPLLKILLVTALFCIFLPMAVTVLWSITGRWPWPELLPESYTLRTVKELLFGSASLPKLLLSSISLALTVGILGTVIGILTARATELYRFRGKALVYMGSFFPLLVPGILSSMCMGFILSYSQYFTTLMVGGGRVKTIALVLVPYIQSGDRALSSVYSVAFVGSALLVFFLFEGIIHNLQKGEDPL